MRTGLFAQIERLARAESLLVVTDFDGTLAPLQADPATVTAHPVAVAALQHLAQQPRTEVVVLSGRHLAGLHTVCPLTAPVVLVGSHGAEPSDGAVVLTSADQAYLADIESRLRAIVAGHEPAYVEVKPYQRVIHVAPLIDDSPDLATTLLHKAMQLDTGGRPKTPGSNIVEFSAVDVSKGTWVEVRKKDFAATMFAGDDVTDESVFPILGAADLGVKVGTAETAADWRVASVSDMAEAYALLAAERAKHLAQATGVAGRRCAPGSA